MAFWNKNKKESSGFYRYKEGTHAWKRIAGGFATTKVRMITTSGFALITAGSPWWVPADALTFLEGDVRISVPVSVAILICAGVLWLLFFLGTSYLQKRAIRSLKMKRELHNFAHRLRDEYMEAQKSQRPVHEMSDRICAQLLEYFRILTKRNDISVAIRIARKQKGQTAYETMGRAGLNQHRHKTTQALKEDQGVANLMLHMSDYVLYYPDVIEAEKMGKDVYYLTDNDRTYPDDVRSLMVAPINGWDGENDSMLGMLFLGSQMRGSFGEIHTDALMFVGDSLASLYSELASQARRLEVTP